MTAPLAQCTYIFGANEFHEYFRGTILPSSCRRSQSLCAIYNLAYIKLIRCDKPQDLSAACTLVVYVYTDIVWRGGRDAKKKIIERKALKSPLTVVEKKVTSHSVGQLYNGALLTTRI